MLLRLSFLLFLSGLHFWYNTSLWLVLPKVVDFGGNLHEAFTDIIGFRWLEIDVAQAQQAASEMLRECGVNPKNCTGSVTTLDAQNSETHLTAMNESFHRSLHEIWRFSNDRFFEWGASTLAASPLNAMVASWQSLQAPFSMCSDSVPLNCRVLISATELLDGSPSIQAGIKEIVDRFSRQVYGFTIPVLNVYVHDLYILHILPYVSLMPAVVFDFRFSANERRYRCGRTICACRLLFHLILWLVFFPVVLSIVVFGLDLFLDLGLSQVDILEGKPILATATMLRHVGTEFPTVWQHVMGMRAERGFHGLLVTSAVFVFLCLWVLVSLLCRRKVPHVKECTSQELCNDITAEWKEAPPEELREIHKLKRSQLRALHHARIISRRLHLEALPRLNLRAQMHGFLEEDVTQALNWIRDSAPIVVHLDLQEVGTFLIADSVYRNQIETKSSSGQYDPAARIDWENSLFDGAYSKARAVERCKSGALNVTNDPMGVMACRSYGYSCFVLRGVRLRTTFCASDFSGATMENLATVDNYAHILLRLSDEDLRLQLSTIKSIVQGSVQGKASDLFVYTEAQIHGEIRLADHVELIMAHQSLKAMYTWADLLAGLQRKCGSRVVWMNGRMDTRTVDTRTVRDTHELATIEKVEELPIRSTTISVRVQLPAVPLQPGSTVYVDVGDGQKVQIAVPAGSSPGQWLTVNYVPEARASKSRNAAPVDSSGADVSADGIVAASGSADAAVGVDGGDIDGSKDAIAATSGTESDGIDVSADGIVAASGSADAAVGVDGGDIDGSKDAIAATSGTESDGIDVSADGIVAASGSADAAPVDSSGADVIDDDHDAGLGVTIVSL
eukprot:TRINITY_DN8628_c0_g1_i5.p1 TRINITY_DN8628_c0_g1~~TRINITY_DN8628_c0_g1_i5.p1  ORF type:complete len:847 (+),score=155.43 TRINITY_DN8628_c0_g1_i5:85-2625(+)